MTMQRIVTYYVVLVLQESVNERLPGGWFDTGDLG